MDAEKKTKKAPANTPAEKPAKQTLSISLALVAIVISAGSLYFAKFAQDPQQQTLQVLQTKLSKLEQRQTQLSAANTQASEAMQKIARKANGNSETWLLDDVENLLRLAQQQAEYTHNSATVIRLLTTADKRLSTMTNSAVMPLRKIINANLVKLKSLESVDRAGLLMTLSTLTQRVSKMPVVSTNNETDKPTDKAVEKPQPKWKQAVTTGWQELQKVVVIRSHDKPIKPLVSDAEHQVAVLNIQLLLQQAQWAVLRDQQDVYLASLKQAKTLTTDNFQANVPAATAVIKELDVLSAKNITPKLPNLTPAINAIRSLTKKGS